MTEKELLSQLNNLKNIKPDKEWKVKSREILLSQISAGDYSLISNKQTIKLTSLNYLRNFFHHPALVVTMILIFVLGGGILSIGASQNTKPGDSLYIAKIISEKARATLTFNEEEKAKLGIEFAGNRAKEITQVLAESDNGDKEARVEKLTQNFKKEINSVKTRLKNINEQEEGDKKEENVDVQIFSANLGKDDKGMQVYDPTSEVSKQDSEDMVENPEDLIITTPEVITSTSSTESGDSTISDSSELEKAIEDAERLFAEQDYDGTLDKLEEANNIINQIDETSNEEGTVKGESEKATSTDDNSGGEILGADEEVDGKATTTGE